MIHTAIDKTASDRVISLLYDDRIARGNTPQEANEFVLAHLRAMLQRLCMTSKAVNDAFEVREKSIRKMVIPCPNNS